MPIFYTVYDNNFLSYAYLRPQMKNTIAYYLEDPSRLDEVTVHDVNQWLEERPYNQPLRLLADMKASRAPSNTEAVGVYGAYFAEDYELPTSLKKTKDQESSKVIENIAPLTTKGSDNEEIAINVKDVKVVEHGDALADKKSIASGIVLGSAAIAHNLADDFSENAVEDNLLEVNPNVELVNEVSHSSADELLEDEVEKEVLEEFSDGDHENIGFSQMDDADTEVLEESSFDGNVDYKVYASNVSEDASQGKGDNFVEEADSFSDIDSIINKGGKEGSQEAPESAKEKVDAAIPEVFHEIEIEQVDHEEALGEDIEGGQETPVEGDIFDSIGVLNLATDKKIKSSKKDKKKLKKKTKKKTKKKVESKKKKRSKKKESDKKNEKKVNAKKKEKSKKESKKKPKKKNEKSIKLKSRSVKKSKKSSIKKVKGEIKSSTPVKDKKPKKKAGMKPLPEEKVTYVLVKDERANDFKLTDYAGISSYTNWLLEQKSINGKTSDKKLESRIEKAVSKKKGSSSKKKKSKKKKTKIPQSAAESVKKSDMIISEPLANILAAQGHKKKAKKMYTQLGLIFPEKSGYFAAQIEKLKKK